MGDGGRLLTGRLNEFLLAYGEAVEMEGRVLTGRFNEFPFLVVREGEVVHRFGKLFCQNKMNECSAHQHNC